VVGGIAHSVDLLVRERFFQRGDHVAGQLDRGCGALAGPEPKQHRQADWVAAKRQPHHDPGDHPAVAPTEFGRSLRGSVVGPKRVVDLFAPAPKQGVIDGDGDRRAGVEQPVDNQPGDSEPELIGVPTVVGEEPACRMKRHQRGHPGAGEHADHAAAHRAGDQPGCQQNEHRERRGPAKHRPQCLQQFTPRGR
jgi:hypothetical protein